MRKNEKREQKHMIYLMIVPCLVFLVFLTMAFILQKVYKTEILYTTSKNSPSVGRTFGNQGTVDDGEVSIIPWVKLWYNILGVILLAWIYFNSYVLAVNYFAFRSVGGICVPILDVSIGQDYFRASASNRYSPKKVGKIIFTAVVALLFTVVVAPFGWLLFILYKKNKFMYKTKLKSIERDEAESLIYNKSDNVFSMATYFYRMLEYAYIYTMLKDKKNKREILNIARELLNLWYIVETGKFQ